ncbi:glycosyltransferase family 2 protein [Nanoarchaeota archaeon]
MRGKTLNRSKKPKIIGVILAYNCAKMLPRAYERIPKGVLSDIIVMDDGSKDNTSQVAKKLGLKVFRHTPNRGYGGNLKEGLKKALSMGADYVFEIHGDGAQFDPKSIFHAIEPMNKGAQLILGSRFQQPKKALENGMPLVRFLGNKFLSFFDRVILGLPLTEFHTGFRVYGKEFLKKVPYMANTNNYLFSFEIIAQAAYYGVKVREVPVEADYKSAHTSHVLSNAALYALQTFLVLGKFILAKMNISHNHLFPKLKK